MRVAEGALEPAAPEHPPSSRGRVMVIKTGCNGGCLKRKAWGLRLVLEYFRLEYGRTGRVPLYVRVSSVASSLGLGGDRGARTSIGVALGHLARNGYLLRGSNGRNKGYYVLDTLLDHFEAYPCLRGCTSDGSVCGLLGTPQCPFLQGVAGGWDYG